MREIVLSNEFVKIETEDNMVIWTWKIDDLTDTELVKKLVELRLEVTKNEPYFFLADARSVKKASKESRDFLASKKGTERVLASAIIVDSMFTAAIANFFLRVSKPDVSTKLFSNEEDAINWFKTL